MSFLTRLLEARSDSFENPSTSLANPAAWLVHFFGGGEAMAGVHVNERSAAGVPAIYACVRIIAEAIACLPLQVMERLPGGGRQPAVDHPLYELLHDRPNDVQTSFVLRETASAHQALWGNGYMFVERDARSLRPLGLYTLMPDQLTPKRVGREIVYEHRPTNGPAIQILAGNILHWPALGWDGIQGVSPIRLMRESVGLSMATERFGARFFGSGAHPSGILTHPQKFSSDAVQERVLASWTAAHSGLNRSQKTAILEEGMDWKAITIPPEDAQFLQTRELQVREAARMYKVPLHMLADMTGAPAANVEQNAIDFVVHTITPWVVRQEQEMNLKLLREDERKRYFIKYNVTALLRGDSRARAEFYKSLFGIGALSPNDIRSLEDMNPIEGGDRYFVPLNMVPIESADAVLENKTEPAPRAVRALPPGGATRSIQVRQRLQTVHRRLFVAAAQAVSLRELERVGRQAKRLLAEGELREWEEWLRSFYQEFQGYVARQFLPSLQTFGELVQAEALDEVGGELSSTHDLDGFLAGYAGRMARGYCASSRNQLLALSADGEQAERAAAVQGRLEEWRDKRPDKVADRQIVEASNAVSLATYAAVGIVAMRWVTVGDNCPLCRSMDGRVVGISESFVAQGETVSPAGAEPLTARRTIRHPPLHGGCNCIIVAGG